MTLTLTAPTRPSISTAREAAPAPVEFTASPPKSSLDLALDGLAKDHRRHAGGPVFPCPLCFDPSLLRAR